MLKVAAVNYLNTKPLLYGLFKHNIDAEIELRLEIPSECARLMEEGEVDMALMPVAAIPGLSKAEIITDYCIGATGKVDTVCLFSECPLQDIEEIYLDYHSRTSVQLLQVLLREHWRVSPKLVPAQAGFEQNISGNRAALIIGDRTVFHLGKHAYIYDLAEEWYKFTNGLPFVFAAWVSHSKLSTDFLTRFNAALAEGVRSIPQIKFLLRSPHEGFNLERYFTECIDYKLDNEKKSALKLFFSLLSGNKVS